MVTACPFPLAIAMAGGRNDEHNISMATHHGFIVLNLYHVIN